MLIIDLETGTIIGTNIVVVGEIPDEDMSDSEIIEYGANYGQRVEIHVTGEDPPFYYDYEDYSCAAGGCGCSNPYCQV